MEARSLRILALCAVALGALSGQTKLTTKSWTPPKTAWGDPDLQGVWTSDDFYGVPFAPPARKKPITSPPACRQVFTRTPAIGPGCRAWTLKPFPLTGLSSRAAPRG